MPSPSRLFCLVLLVSVFPLLSDAVSSSFGAQDSAALHRNSAVETPLFWADGEQDLASPSSSTASLAAAACDTFYLYGGPGSLEGKFQSELTVYGGAPDPQGWTGEDVSVTDPFWHATTTNAATLGGGAPDNHAIASTTCTPTWCGYGNGWDDRLEFRFDVTAAEIDPATQSTTVRLTCQYVHDTELQYDFLVFEVIRAGVPEILLAVDGTSYTTDPVPYYSPVDFDSDELGGIVFAPGDYEDGSIVLRVRVWSDGGWSDEDGLNPTEGRGAAALDDMRVFINGALVSEATWEPIPPGASEKRASVEGYENGAGVGTTGWAPVLVDFAGDFSKLVQVFSDIDPCASNPSPQWCFIDDGTPPNNAPGESTGGSLSPTWSYGIRGGWVVNYNGGVSYGEKPLRNFVVSPEIEYDLPGSADDVANGAVGLRFDAYMHFPWSNGMFMLWQVRSFRSEVGWGSWLDFSTVFSNGGIAAYVNYEFDMSALLDSEPDKLQVRIGVVDFADTFGVPGNDATPAALIDNVAVYKTCLAGPAIEVVAPPKSGFPADGTLDGPMRWDSVTGVGVWDSMVISVSALIPGTALADPVHGGNLRGALEANPQFGDLAGGARSQALNLLGATQVGSSYRGWPVYTFSVLGQQVTGTGGVALEDLYFFDLPDGPGWPLRPSEPDEPGLLFPGDVLHFYYESVDTGGNVSTYPRDTAGFLDFSSQTPYGRVFRNRCLPTVDATDSPKILIASGNNSKLNAYQSAANQLGLLPGIDFDEYYYTFRGFVGYGGPAAAQLVGYEVLVHDSNTGLLPADANVLTFWWLQDGPRAQFVLGPDAVEVMESRNDGELLEYLRLTLGTELTSGDRAPFVGEQSSPVATPILSCFTNDFVPFGGCPDRTKFDLIGPHGPGPTPTHEFLSESGQPYQPSVPVGIWWDRTAGGYSRVSGVFPFSLEDVRSDVDGTSGNTSTSTSTEYLKEMLECVGPVMGSGAPTAVDGAARHELVIEAIRPNPFNPSTNIVFHAPGPGHVSVEIFNLRGQHVVTLLDGHVQSGQRELRWDARAESGAGVASGVYLCRIKGFGQEVTQRMVVLK